MDQKEFVKTCLKKYETTALPVGEFWEEAHFPTPSCKGGTNTVLLWSSDHSLQGILQSEEFDHPCIHSAREHWDRKKLTIYYPKFLPLFEKWLKRLKSIGGSACLEKHPWIHSRGGVAQGELDDNNLQRLHDRRKEDSNFNDEWIKHHLVASARGGRVAGALNKGRRWFNNGVVEKTFLPHEVIPHGYTSGRLPRVKGRRWFTDGSVERTFLPHDPIPQEFEPGRLPRPVNRTDKVG